MNKFKEILKKMWSKITESKLNISMFIAGVIAFILLAVILGVIIHRDGEVNNELLVTGSSKDTDTTKSSGETTEDEEETTEEEEQYSTEIDEDATTNIVSKASRLSATVSVKNSWTNDGEYFIQYSLEVTNVSDEDIDGWAAVLDMTETYTLVDSWNFTFKEGSKKLIINPFNDNREIPAGETVTGGFIVKGTSNVYVNYITMYVGDKIETIKNGNTYIPSTTTYNSESNDSTTSSYSDDTTTVEEPLTDNSYNETTTLEENESETDESVSAESQSGEKQSDDTDTSSSSEIITPESTTPPETETTAEIVTSTQTEIVTPEDSAAQ